MMSKRLVRAVLLLLCLCSCICLFPACQKSNPMAKTGFASLAVDSNKTQVTASVTLNTRDAEKFKGQTLGLYELLPGESLSVLGDRQPIVTAKAAASVSMRFPLAEGDRTRLYSSFVLGIIGGEVLEKTLHSIDDVSALVQTTAPFLWTGSPKGVWNADADDAAALGAMHTLYTVQVSALLNGKDIFPFCGNSYCYNKAELDRLDTLVKKANAAGLQVSLMINFDTLPSISHAAAIFDMLGSRYCGGEYGTVTAFFLDLSRLSSSPEQAAKAAELCLLANLALGSRVQNSRVYLHLSNTAAAIGSFFDAVITRLADEKLSWGASVSLRNPAELELLPELSTKLLSSSRRGHASYFAVNGIVSTLDMDAENGEALQAADFAYQYLTASASRASLIYYTSYRADLDGIRTYSGESRRLTETFAAIDAGLSDEDKQLFASLLGDKWSKLSTISPTHTTKTGVATAGTGGLKEDLLFDFTKGSTLGFSGVNAVTALEMRDSATFSSPVLFTWLEPKLGNGAGVRKLLPNASELEGAVSLSVNLLTQIPETEKTRVRLRLDGVASDGGLLTYTAATNIQNGSWQTVTFQISEFAVAVDRTRPCLLTLTTDDGTSVKEPYTLWVEGVQLHHPESGYTRVLPIVLIVGGALVGCAGVLLIYCTVSKNRRDRRRGR